MVNEERPLRKPKRCIRLVFWALGPPVLINVIIFGLIFGWLLIDHFRQKWFGSPESSQAYVAEDIDKTLLELNVRDSLNRRARDQNLGVHCLSVSLVKESPKKYVVHAIFDRGQQSRLKEQIHVEVGRKEDSGEFHFCTDLPPILAVPLGTLPSYEHTSIAKAFNAFFSDPNWTSQTAENGARFVEFTGRLKGASPRLQVDEGRWWTYEQGDAVCIRFVISIDGAGFSLWSVRIGEELMRANDWQRRGSIDKLFEAIYDLK